MRTASNKDFNTKGNSVTLPINNERSELFEGYGALSARLNSIPEIRVNQHLLRDSEILRCGSKHEVQIKLLRKILQTISDTFSLASVE
jgi:hypothetical protein